LKSILIDQLAETLEPRSDALPKGGQTKQNGSRYAVVGRGIFILFGAQNSLIRWLTVTIDFN
jgi:hypothetical protein